MFQKEDFCFDLVGLRKFLAVYGLLCFQIKSKFWLLALIGVSNGFFNVAMQLAYKTVPNIGYVSIINLSSISVIMLLSTIFFKDRLSIEKVIGVLGMTLGLILLIIL